MTLPTKFAGVHYYKIAGRYIFAGDLFIATRTIYFFPAVDLSEQRETATKNVPHHVGLVVLAIVYLLQQFQSYASRSRIWRPGISSDEFQKAADEYIKWLAEERATKEFGQTLPLPLRVSADELPNLRLSVGGKLSLTAQSDNHDFNVGWRRRNTLRDALWLAGFGRV